MKAKLTLEIEGSKEEIDIITQRIKSIAETQQPKMKVKSDFYLPQRSNKIKPFTNTRTRTKTWKW